MECRLPSHEELVDLSWLLDSALARGDHSGATESAGRLLESLSRHHDATTRLRPVGGAATAAHQDASATLLADVALLLARLHGGDTVDRVEFRHRVEALAVGPTVLPGNAA